MWWCGLLWPDTSLFFISHCCTIHTPLSRVLSNSISPLRTSLSSRVRGQKSAVTRQMKLLSLAWSKVRGAVFWAKATGLGFFFLVFYLCFFFFFLLLLLFLTSCVVSQQTWCLVVFIFVSYTNILHRNFLCFTPPPPQTPRKVTTVSRVYMDCSLSLRAPLSLRTSPLETGVWGGG